MVKTSRHTAVVHLGKSEQQAVVLVCLFASSACSRSYRAYRSSSSCSSLRKVEVLKEKMSECYFVEVVGEMFVVEVDSRRTTKADRMAHQLEAVGSQLERMCLMQAHMDLEIAALELQLEHRGLAELVQKQRQ